LILVAAIGRLLLASRPARRRSTPNEPEPALARCPPTCGGSTTARLGAVDSLLPPGSRKEQSWEQLFWNTSVKRLLLLGSPPIDRFASKHVQVARDGTLLVDERPVRRPLLVQTYASTVQLTGPPHPSPS
jgi:hypothetical protein